MKTETRLKGVAIALLVVGLVSGGMIWLAGTAGGDEAPMRVLTRQGREIGVLVNGQFHPHPGAVDSVKLVPCSLATKEGRIWTLCRAGFAFNNAFEYRKYVLAKRALERYTGPVIIEVNGQRNPSYLQDGRLR